MQSCALHMQHKIQLSGSVGFNTRFIDINDVTCLYRLTCKQKQKPEWGNCHKQWARKFAAQKAIIMKLLGLFLLFLGLCSRLAFLGSWLTILGFFNSSSFIFIVSAALGREFMASGIHTLVYRHIYVPSRVSCATILFHFILF